MNKVGLIKSAWIFNFFIVIAHASAFSENFIPDPEKVLEEVRKSPRYYCKQVESVTFCNTNHEYENLEEARLDNSDFVLSKFGHANLARANLKRAKFSLCDMSNTNMNETLSSDAQYFDVKFVGADLSRADFSNAVLTNVNLYGAKLHKTNFSGATLNQVICQNPGAASEKANLRGCKYFDKLMALVVDSKVQDYNPSLLVVSPRASLGSIGKKNSLGSIGSIGSLGRKSAHNSLGRSTDSSSTPKGRTSISRSISNPRGERSEKIKRSIITSSFFESDIAD